MGRNTSVYTYRRPKNDADDREEGGSLASSVWLERAEHEPGAVAAAIDAGLQATGHLPADGELWSVKLNLTYPSYLRGVVNAPAFVEGLCQWAADAGVKLELVEGDGGNGSYSAKDTFEGNGVAEIASRYEAKCVSISETPWEWRETMVQGKSVRLPYSPYFRRKQYDRFVVAPLFKNHIFTNVTLGMKNLWGCIPDAYRMYYHHMLDRGIVALYKELLPDFAIFDGLIAMRGRGPMEGQPLDMNAIMVSKDVPSGEVAALRIMGVPIEQVRHLWIADSEGLLPKPSEIEWLSDPTPFERTDFVVKRTALNRMSILLGGSPGLQRLIYHSRLSPAIYGIVNRIRGDSAQSRLVRDKWAGRYQTTALADRDSKESSKCE